MKLYVFLVLIFYKLQISHAITINLKISYKIFKIIFIILAFDM